MNVAAIAADIVKAAMKPPRKHRQEHRRCVLCGLIVGEAVWIKDECEYERYVKTDKGLVCEVCYDGPRPDVWKPRLTLTLNRCGAATPEGG